MWATGEQLNASPERAAATGSDIISGIQGSALQALQPATAPPFASYFISKFNGAQARGVLGDIEIWRACPQVVTAPSLPAPVTTAVACAGMVLVDGACLVPVVCPAGTSFDRGRCIDPSCPAGYIRIQTTAARRRDFAQPGPCT